MLATHRHGVVAAAAIAAAASIAGADPAPTGFADMLDMVPATALGEEGAILYYVDLDLAWDRLGVGDDPAERADALGQFARVDTFSMVPQLFHDPTDVEGARAEVGFSTLEINRELAVLSPPTNLIVDSTSATPDAVLSAIESNPDWSPQLEQIESDHGEYFTWGDGLDINPERISAFRRLGQAGQFGVIGDDDATTVRTLEEGDMEAALASIAGDGESAADTGPFSLVDEALSGDVLQVVGVPRSNPVMMPINLPIDEIEEFLEETTFMVPYQGLVVAELIEGGDVRTEILLINFDDATAQENADRAATMIDEYVDPVDDLPLAEVLPNASVTVEGTIVRVTIEGAGHFARPLNLLSSGELFPTG